MKYYKIEGHYSGEVVTAHGPDPRDETYDAVSGDFVAEVIAHSPEEAIKCLKEFDFYKWDDPGVDDIFIDSIEELEEFETPDEGEEKPSLEIFETL